VTAARRPSRSAVFAIRASRQRDRCENHTAHKNGDDDLDAYITELVARAPPLSSEQRDKLTLLLNSPRRAA
jgi:hypothetical protein